MAAVLMAVALFGCEASLARHAAAFVPRTAADVERQRQIAGALQDLDDLRRQGWLARIASGGCARSFDRQLCASPEATEEEDVIGTLGDELVTETTPAPCRAALDRLERVGALRHELEVSEADGSVLLPFARAVREIDPEPEGCPEDAPGAAGAVLAIARRGELTFERMGLGGAALACRVSSLGGAVRLETRASRATSARITGLCSAGSCGVSVWVDTAAAAGREAYVVDLVVHGPHGAQAVQVLVVRRGAEWRVVQEVVTGEA